MYLVLASHNKKKITELRELLSDLSDKIEVVSASDVGVGDIEETGDTFEENSLMKAQAVAGAGRWAVADDSGLEVDKLGGAPGIYSARYSGGDDSDNIDKLLRELDGVPTKERSARFVCCVTVISPEGKVTTVRGECEGIITEERMGDNGFGYDPVFYIPSFKRTFAQLTHDEKNSISHRGAAMRKVHELLKNNIS